MNIKPAIYEVLTPRQRIISMIDAIGREDEIEIKRLNESCDKKRYRMPDTKYSDTLDRLFNMSMAVEVDLRGVIIGFLEADNNKEQQDMCIQEISNINSAWFELLKSMGIDKDSMLKAAAPRHHLIGVLLNIAPPANETKKQETLKEMKEYISV